MTLNQTRSNGTTKIYKKRVCSRDLIEKVPIEIWDYILDLLPRFHLRSTSLNLSRVLSSIDPTKTNDNEHSYNHKISIVHFFKHLIVLNDFELKALLDQLNSDGHHSVSIKDSPFEKNDPEDCSPRTNTKDEGERHIEISTIPRSFTLRSWRLKDNNILINVLNMFSKNLNLIDLFIGPLFGPDQLEELFFKPKIKLETLILRFNQNVSKRSYEPFLKGSYFDGCLDLLANWPESSTFRSLSIVQDLPPPLLQKSNLINEGIAQPIVFFRFWCITNLARSPIGSNLLNLRLRVPGRNLATSLTVYNNSNSNTNTSINQKVRSIAIGLDELKLPVEMFPNLRYLDISTSYLPSISSGLVPILKTYPNLEHLILDRTQLIVPSRFEGDEERVNESIRSIGISVAAVGISRSTEVSRLWREFHRLVDAENQRIRTGKGGSLKGGQQRRDAPPTSSNDRARNPNPISKTQRLKNKGGRSAFVSPRWKDDNQTTPIQSTSNQNTSEVEYEKKKVWSEEQIIPDKIIIIPSFPKLKSICIGTELIDESDGDEEMNIRNSWKDQFEIGWKLGIEKLESNIDEKLSEWKRSIEVFEKSIKKISSSSSSSKGKVKTNEKDLKDRLDVDDGSERFIRAKRPRLMKFNENRNNHERDGPDRDYKNDGERDVFEEFKRTMNLIEIECNINISEEEEGDHRRETIVLNELIGRKKLEGGLMVPKFCSIPDCCSVGRVAWNASSQANNIIIPSITRGEKNPSDSEDDFFDSSHSDHSDDEVEKVEKRFKEVLRLGDDHEDDRKEEGDGDGFFQRRKRSRISKTFRRKSSFHEVGCGHLFGRDLWNVY